MIYNAKTGKLFTPSTPIQGGVLPLNFSVSDREDEGLDYDTYRILGIYPDGNFFPILGKEITASDCYDKGFAFILVINDYCNYDEPWRTETIYSIPSK